MKQRFRSGGLAAWSVHHPVGVSMISLTLVVLGIFSLQHLGMDLLPHIIYPEVRVRVLDSGVPANVMEDRITRQLEEQLAITEDVISIQSQTSEGNSAVTLSFPYGKDMDVALRDASTRLDRARRFLPTRIEPPIIVKRDPSQLPVAELVLSSALMGPVELRSWADYELSKWFLNLPGVAAVEIGGGLEREVQILPDQRRLQALGLRLQDLMDAVREENLDTPLGRLFMPDQEASARLAGRISNPAELAEIPIPVAQKYSAQPVRLGDVARILDTHQDEKLRIRLNGMPGVKLSIQKQPQANTVAVVDALRERLDWLRERKLLPVDVQLTVVGDQALYVRNALSNAVYAALSGAALAMLVVFLFLGDLRRTLVIGTAIPIALMATFFFMSLGGLTLNIMTLGGLALGVGMLVDSAIVMLENITRQTNEQPNSVEHPAVIAAQQVNSAIVASTSTNLAAILPFLFIGGLVGLLFRELIFTIAASTLAAMLVALTLVPALGAKVPSRPVQENARPNGFIRLYVWFLGRLLPLRWLVIIGFLLALVFSVPILQNSKQIFLPDMDEGLVTLSVRAEPGIALDTMDDTVARIESLLLADPQIESVFSQIGGSVFGRSQFEASHRSSLSLQLRAVAGEKLDSQAWMKQMQRQIDTLQLVGVEVRMRSPGIRGIRLSQGDDDISLRIQGKDQEQLRLLAEQFTAALQDLKGIRNLAHSLEDSSPELSIQVDRQKATALGFNLESIGDTVQVLLNGQVLSDFIDHDRPVEIRLRMPRQDLRSPEALSDVLLYNDAGHAVRLGELAEIQWQLSPAQITRDQQQRIVEISAGLTGEKALSEVMREIEQRLSQVELPSGYLYYDGGAGKSLQEGQQMSFILLGLAIFLVFVVMAVQYESLRNPFVILCSVPFTVTGVALGIYTLDMPLSMPVWLGLIMLSGMVVNTTIVLVETIEQQKELGVEVAVAILTAARLRLRPVMMTTLSTVLGLLPLALGWGQGAEMLQPLAVTIVFGLSFSLLVSLVLVPMMYQVLGN